MTYKVRVTKDSLVFSAGHFITFNGDHCERIHGHNYRVAVEVEDDLDENGYVFDFIALRDQTKAIVDELDHRMLLPASSTMILLEDDGESNIVARYRDRYWSFPREECVVLPVPNTTAELLATYIEGRLRGAWAGLAIAMPRVVARRGRGVLRPVGLGRVASRRGRAEVRRRFAGFLGRCPHHPGPRANGREPMASQVANPTFEEAVLTEGRAGEPWPVVPTWPTSAR